MNYKLHNNVRTGELTSIIRFNDDNTITSFVVDESSQDYQTYLKWLEEGNTPEPADEQGA